MHHFLKINVISILYAIVLVIPIELMINANRISRLLNWGVDTVIILSCVTSFGVVILGTVALYYLSKNWMEAKKWNYSTIVLWFPYFILFVYTIASLFPTSYGGDIPSPVTGLLAIAALFIYPLYILTITIFSSAAKTSH